MYCVIQEIKLKKTNMFGHHKELEADSFTYTVNGITYTKYTFNYSNERFDRPIRSAYKISIHKSKRINGVVTKKQYVITTVDYYSLVDFWIGDCLSDKKLKAIAAELETSTDNLWDLINAKVDPLQERIQEEFEATEEYKASKEHQKIIDKYNKSKAKFAKTYGCDASEYDYCYNVFGELMNNDYLSKIIKDYEAKRSYQENYHSNYSGYDRSSSKNDYSSYFNKPTSNYNDTEKEMLKKFYRILSKTFHPDNTEGSTAEMQLVNKLKSEWGL